MKRHRPVRAWIGEAHTDPAELCGPRGLVEEVLSASDDDVEPDVSGDDAFFASLMTPERLARIDAVIDARLESVTAVLDRLVDPHNVAAILRTGEGLGLCAVHVVPAAESDAFAHRKVTQDAHKWIDVVQHGSGPGAVRSLRDRGFAVFAGHLERAARPPSELPTDRPIALLFGHEHEGPSPETLRECTGTFRIPMAGFTQSFNVSVAAGIALSQICAARRAFLNKPGDLDVPRKQAMRSRYLRLGAKLARRLARYQ
ncbi:MAG: TrmH family RNA methyltransferase [Myxococcales bacterium]